VSTLHGASRVRAFAIRMREALLLVLRVNVFRRSRRPERWASPRLQSDMTRYHVGPIPFFIPSPFYPAHVTFPSTTLTYSERYNPCFAWELGELSCPYYSWATWEAGSAFAFCWIAAPSFWRTFCVLGWYEAHATLAQS